VTGTQTVHAIARCGASLIALCCRRERRLININKLMPRSIYYKNIMKPTKINRDDYSLQQTIARAAAFAEAFQLIHVAEFFDNGLNGTYRETRGFHGHAWTE